MSTSTIPSPPQTQALSSRTFCPPPIDGSMTLPEIFDWHLANTPDHRLFVFSKDDGGIRTIYWPEAVRAIHVGARVVRKRMNWTPGMKENPVVAILAPSDTIPYFTTVMSIMRANYVAFPISPRNSPEVVAYLISKVAVKHILVGREQSMLDLVKSALDILETQYPSATTPEMSPMLLFEELFLSTAEAVPADGLVYDKSKGSTAFPKPIPVTASRLVAYCLIPWFGGRDLTNQVLSLHAMPMYHGMGLLQLSWTASCGLVASTFEPKSPSPVPTLDALFKDAKATNSDIIFCVPSFIEAWAREPDYVKWLATRGGLFYGGGPLNKEAGDFLTSQGVSIFILYGCSEGGIMSPVLPATVSYDWEYFTFPKLVTPKMVPNGNNTFELVTVSNEYHQLNVFNTKVDGRDAYATSDLLAPHPTKPGYWRVFGRTDDQIMHNTGEKTNPGPLENILNQDPHVQSSVMFGRGRFQAGILVDPKIEFKFDPADGVKLAAFRNNIWPTVERMNTFAPQHSRLFKEMILVANPSKPFTYTAKNTARRQAIINLYEDEINEAYNLVEESAQDNIPVSSHWDVVAAREFVRAVVVKVLGRNIDDDDDLFQHGCDSLQATWIRNTILRGLRDSAQLDVRRNFGNFVYEYPSIARLSTYISALAFGTDENADISLEKKVDTMRAMAAKYSENLPMHQPIAGIAPLQTGDVVLLTGTTGSLGCHILVQLSLDPQILRIYALNRGSKSGVALLERQKIALLERGLDAAILDSGKVVLLEGDLTSSYFGVPESVFKKMHQSVTHIIHNAWRVDFNLSLVSFESNVKGLRHLIDWALSSPLPKPPQLIYTSSIGVFQNLQANDIQAEAAIEPNAAVGSGYAESKWVSEQILSEAAAKTTLKPVVVRVGQVTGGVDGAWNVNEWFPSLVQTAAAMGYFPDDTRDVNWIPSEYASRAIADFRRASEGNLFVHLNHPRPVSWSSLASVISSELSIKLISYAEWLAMLQEGAQLSSEGGSDRVDVALLRKHRALRLLPFFKRVASLENGALAMGFPDLSIKHAMALSPTLADPQIRELGPDDVRKWLTYWRQLGVFSTA
ncbi:hypothetical protein BKA93DRAFT_894740 [Sparassis latifolia]